MARLSLLLLLLINIQFAKAQTATAVPSSPTPELSMMVTVVPPGMLSDSAQDAVVVYEVNLGDALIGVLLFAMVLLLLLNVMWSARRGQTSGPLKAVAVVFLIGVVPFHGQAQTNSAQWCGYALIENVPNVEAQLPLLSRLTIDAVTDGDPSDLFQSRISLDGTKAIIEGCWLVFPTRELIVNWITLSGGADAKESVDLQMVYSLFAPDGSREDSAASVRDFLSKNAKDWETPDVFAEEGAK